MATKNFWKTMVSELIDFMKVDFSETKFKEYLNAYNRYITDETDGTEYIYNLNNKDDLIELIKQGVNRIQLHNCITCNYIYYRETNSSPKAKVIIPLSSNDVMYAIKNNYMEEMADSILYLPYNDEYKVIYDRFSAHLRDNEI